MVFYKYQGAGNDFLIADNRDGSINPDCGQIRMLCDRHYGVGADGLMLLEKSTKYDFKMVYYNSDGSGGMMCGNGGRCIVAFAADLGFGSFDFEAADGFHTAELLEDRGKEKIVRLKMKNVTCIKQENEDSWFIDTGTRHAVRFAEGLDNIDVVERGRKIRYDSLYSPEGANANFAQILHHDETNPILGVRTYEKGVENETCACGTGITACAIAASVKYPDVWHPDCYGKITVNVKALNDMLAVDFKSDGNGGFEEVWLTGPVVKVAEIRTCNK